MNKIKLIFYKNKLPIYQILIISLGFGLGQITAYAASPTCSSVFSMIKNNPSKSLLINHLIQVKLSIDSLKPDSDKQHKTVLIEKYLSIFNEGITQFGPGFEIDFYNDLTKVTKLITKNKRISNDQQHTKIREFFPTRSQIDHVTANSSFFNEVHQTLSVLHDTNKLITYQFPKMTIISEISLPTRLNHLIGNEQTSILIASSSFGDVYKIDLKTKQVEIIPEVKSRNSTAPKYKLSRNGEWLVIYERTNWVSNTTSVKENFIIQLYNLKNKTFFQKYKDTPILEYDFLDNDHYLYFHDSNHELNLVDLKINGPLYAHEFYNVFALSPIFDHFILSSNSSGNISLIDLHDFTKTSVSSLRTDKIMNLEKLQLTNDIRTDINQEHYLVAGKASSQVAIYKIAKDKNSNLRRTKTLTLETIDYDGRFIDFKYDSDLPGYVLLTDKWIYLFSNEGNQLNKVTKKSNMTYYQIMENGKYIIDFSNRSRRKDGKLTFAPEDTESPAKIYNVEHDMMLDLPQKLSSYDYVKNSSQHGYIFAEQVQIRELKLPLITLEVFQLYQEFDAKK